MINEISIIGIGNILQNDDGIGIKILMNIDANYQFPSNIELVDGGTSGSSLDTAIYKKDWVIVIDALDVAGEPGTVKLLRGDQFINRPASTKMSPHQVGFLDLIQLMNLEGSGPAAIDLIGIIPEDISDGNVISSTVNDSMNVAIEKLMELLKTKGIIPAKKNPPEKSNYWWLTPE